MEFRNVFMLIIALLIIQNVDSSNCVNMVPPGTVYISNMELIDDPNKLLLSISIMPDDDASYYRIMSDDGELSAAFNQSVYDAYPKRDWFDFSESTDITETSIINMTGNADRNDPKVDIKLRRNGVIINIIGIMISRPLSSYGFNYKYFTFNSMNTTFIILQPQPYLEPSVFDTIALEFESQTDNTVTSKKSIDGPTWELDMLYNPKKLNVNEDAKAIRVYSLCFFSAITLIEPKTFY